MERAEALARLESARVGHLATVRPDGTPHVVPVTFAVAGDSIVTAIDHKPKTTLRLQRLINIEKAAHASLLVDHFSEDWDRLWWVRVDGRASVHDQDETWLEAVAALTGKYDQYTEQPPRGPVIAISPDRVRSWASTP